MSRWHVGRGCICSEHTIVVLGVVSKNVDLHDTVSYIYSRRIKIDYPKFRTFGGFDFFAMVILLLLLVDKRYKPCSVEEDSFIRPLTADLRFAGHGAILFVGLKASKITCLLFMPTAKITKNVSAAADGGNVPYSTLISIKTKV